MRVTRPPSASRYSATAARCPARSRPPQPSLRRPKPARSGVREAGPRTANRRSAWASLGLPRPFLPWWWYELQAAASGLPGSGAGVTSRAAATTAAAASRAAARATQWRRRTGRRAGGNGVAAGAPAPALAAALASAPASARTAARTAARVSAGAATTVVRTRAVSWRSRSSREAQSSQAVTWSWARWRSPASSSPRLKAVSWRRNSSQVIGLHPSQLGEQHRLQPAAGPVQPRQDGPAGHVQHSGRLGAGQPVDVDQGDGHAEVLGEAGDGPPDGLAVQLTDGLLLGPGLGAGQVEGRVGLALVQPHQRHAPPPPVLGAEQVVLDPQQPGPAVGSRLEGAEGPQGPQVGLLGQVLGGGLVPGKPQSGVVERVHVRNGRRLEAFQVHRRPHSRSSGAVPPPRRTTRPGRR